MCVCVYVYLIKQLAPNRPMTYKLSWMPLHSKIEMLIKSNPPTGGRKI